MDFFPFLWLTLLETDSVEVERESDIQVFVCFLFFLNHHNGRGWFKKKLVPPQWWSGVCSSCDCGVEEKEVRAKTRRLGSEALCHFTILLLFVLLCFLSVKDLPVPERLH